MKRILIILLLHFCARALGQSTPQLDTIVITTTSLFDNYFHPHRTCVGTNQILYRNPSQYNTPYYDSSKVIKGHLDSIKVNFQVINKYNQDYYLIVYDSLHRKRLEGKFFDRFPNGHIIEYHENGIIKSSGQSILRTSNRKYLVCSGSYNSCCPKVKVKIYDNRYSETISLETFDTNGQLIRSQRTSLETNEAWVVTYGLGGEIVKTEYYKNGKLKPNKTSASAP